MTSGDDAGQGTWPAGMTVSITRVSRWIQDSSLPSECLAHPLTQVVLTSS
jgi:hypothetical protein